jgi:hypothetical protein
MKMNFTGVFRPNTAAESWERHFENAICGRTYMGRALPRFYRNADFTTRLSVALTPAVPAIPRRTLPANTPRLGYFQT